MKPKKATAPSDSQRDSQDLPVKGLSTGKHSTGESDNQNWSIEFDEKFTEGRLSENGRFKKVVGTPESIKDFIQQQIDKSYQVGFQEAVGKIKDIYDAWNNPGPEPEYHRGWQNTLRSDWPTLARALDSLKPTPEPVIEEVKEIT